MPGFGNLGLMIISLTCGAIVYSMPSSPRHVFDADDAKMYLQRFNHMGRDNMQTGEMLTEDDFVGALISFQQMANLTASGVLDNETMDKMNMPRCGMPDHMGFSNAARKKRYAALATWGKTDLTWRMNSYSEDLPDEQIDRIMREALELWSDASGLTFTEITNPNPNPEADIVIDFNTGSHGDGNPFDGPGMVLAHAYFPSSSAIGGDAHFDDGEPYTDLTDDGIDLFQVAAHEFGHSLGLGHSDDPDALMFAFYRGYVPNFELRQDDVDGIQYLYGENTGAADPTMKPFTPGPDGCPAQVDTMVITEGERTFAFIDNLVYEILNDGVAAGYPQPIRQVFTGLPDDLDTSFYWSGNGRTYFFKGNQYWRFSGTAADAGYPRDISEWGGLPADIDAAFVWSGNGRIYFTKGDQYYRFNIYTGLIDKGYPRPLSVWGLPVATIDSAVQWFNKRTYFFAGGNYYRYNDATFAVEGGYPRQTAYWWFGCGENNLAATEPTGGSLAGCLPNNLGLLMSLAFIAVFHLF